MNTKKINIGITCVGSIIGQGIIKSIQKCSFADQINIIGFEYFENSAGSCWIDKTYIMVDILKPDVSENEYIDLLIEKINKETISVLFVGIGFELPMMARNKSKILDKTGCIVIVSSSEQIEMAMDKYKSYEFLKDNNLFYPKTWLPENLDDVEFPVILKPRKGTGSKGVFLIKNRNELLKFLPEIKEPMIQECVGTKDDEYTCGIIYLDGKIQSTICLRRYLKLGNTASAFHSPEIPEAIEEYVKDIAKKFHPFGPANFQLRLGKDGIPKLFEINLRFSGTTGMRPLFGVNEVEILLSHLIGFKRPCIKKKYGEVVRYLEDIFIEH